jgi:hypothetical protein
VKLFSSTFKRIKDALNVVMSLLVPLPWLLEFTPEFLANFNQLLVPLEMIKLEAVPKFSVADWAEGNWSRICIFEMVAPIHNAVVINAVEETKAVAKLMHRYFASTHSKLFVIFFLPCELWQLPMDA